jgi:hypothetical protein
MSNIIVREENAIAVLEVMSRFAANPKCWFIFRQPCRRLKRLNNRDSWNIPAKHSLITARMVSAK